MSAMPPNAEVNGIGGSAAGRCGLMIRPCPTARSAFVRLSASLFVVAELARVLCSVCLLRFQSLRRAVHAAQHSSYWSDRGMPVQAGWHAACEKRGPQKYLGPKKEA